MPNQCCMNAVMQCTMGMAPSTLMPTPKTVMTSNMVAANILDHIPIINIPPFGMCQSPSNPMVAAATAAAMGVLTPMPCLPVIPAPGSPGASVVTIEGQKALTSDSKCSCAWTGSIEITDPATAVATE